MLHVLLRLLVKHKRLAVAIALGSQIILLLTTWAYHGPSGQELASVDSFDISPALHGPALSELCASVKWEETRWVECTNMFGGVANIRNSLLNCFRYAIESGANLVIPVHHKRAEVLVPYLQQPSSLFTGQWAGIDYLFDAEFFKATMARHCPKMRLVEHKEQVAGVADAVHEHLENVREIRPKVLGEVDQKRPYAHANTFRQDLDRAFPVSRDSQGKARPTIISFGNFIFDWPIQNDPLELWQTFGRILRFRPQAYQQAAEALIRLQRIAPEGYYGVHLRVEIDGQGFFLEDFKMQSEDYLARAQRSGLKTIYVGSGDYDAIDRFADFSRAKGYNFTVVSKESLLSPARVTQLRQLRWDQQALVDHLLLLKANYFAGIGASTFAVMVASRRHLMAGDGKIFATTDDAYSHIIGGDPLVRWTTFP